jgi:TonB family protein
MAVRPLPSSVGRYEVAGLIGRGGSGVVYRARDPHIGRTVAIKLLNAADDVQRSRFEQEIRLLGTLNHTNIVGIYDCGMHGEQPFIVMEFVEGVTLAEYVSDQTKVPLLRTLQLVRALCSALDYAHNRGIVHRDIKPANLMIDRDGVLKVLDFGVARFGETHATRTGAVIGTPSYMAPEQVAGRSVDKRTDIFAVGVVLYEILASVQAFPGKGKSVWEVMQAVLNEQPVALSLIVPTIDAELERIVRRAIEKDPSGRYASLALLADDLAAVEARHVSPPPRREELEATVFMRRPDVFEPPPRDSRADAGVAARETTPPSRVDAGGAPRATTPSPSADVPTAVRATPPPTRADVAGTPRPTTPPTRANVAAVPRPPTSRVRTYAIASIVVAALVVAAAGAIRMGGSRSRQADPPVTSTVSPAPTPAPPPVVEQAPPTAPADTPPPETAANTTASSAGAAGETRESARGRAAGAADSAAGAGQRGKRTPYDQAIGFLSPGKAANPAKAVTLLQQACNDGDVRGCTDLGWMLENGNRIPKDEARAMALYARACDGGSGSGCDYLANMYRDGRGTAKDNARATTLYQRACEGGSSEGCNNLGVAYASGTSVPKDEAKAVALYARACDGGYAAGCANAGRFLQEGRGGAKDLVRARAAYQKACDGRHARACMDLGLMAVNGEGGDKDAARGVEVLQRSCDSGMGEGCLHLGRIYRDGRGVPKDEQRSVSLLQRACDAGRALGCFDLGAAISNGQGAPKNDALGLAAYRRACEGGLGDGCLVVGERYGRGSGVPRDDAEAARWYKKGCDVGFGDACAALKKATTAPTTQPSTPAVESTAGRNPASNEQPVRVGGTIPFPAKIKDVPPVYPEAAQRAGVRGVVILEAVIDRNGLVTGTKILRSIPLLDDAAQATVRQWQFAPTIVKGVPTPVIMTLTVNFGLK